MEVKQVGPVCCKRGQEFIQELQGGGAEILNGRVEINRMNRNHRRRTARETLLHPRQKSLHIAPLRGGLHFKRSKSRKHSIFFLIGYVSLAWPVIKAVLQDTHSGFEPCRSLIHIIQSIS